MSLPHPKGPLPSFPVLTDEEEAEFIKQAMERDWIEDEDLIDLPEFTEEEKLHQPATRDSKPHPQQ